MGLVTNLGGANRDSFIETIQKIFSDKLIFREGNYIAIVDIDSLSSVRGWTYLFKSQRGGFTDESDRQVEVYALLC